VTSKNVTSKNVSIHDEVNGIADTSKCEDQSDVEDDITSKPQVFDTFRRSDGEGRKMTFLMQSVPATALGMKDDVMDRARDLCGDDIIPEDIESDNHIDDDDEDCIPEPLPEAMIVPHEDLELAFEKSLMVELEKANDETDILYGLDDLDAMPEQKDVKPLSPQEATLATPTVSMDALSLKLWFVKIRNSYRKGVRVVKVNNQGKKYFRTIAFEKERLVVKSSKSQKAMHVSTIRQVKLGYASDEIRKLLDITSELQPVPPPSNCAVVTTAKQSISIVFTTETARNEFLFLMRVEVREGRRKYKTQLDQPPLAIV